MSQLDVQCKGGITTITFRENELSSQQEIKNTFTQIFYLVEITIELKLILSFVNIEIISSSEELLSRLITLKKMVERNEGVLILCDIKTEIAESLIRTKLNTYFTIRENISEALIAFKID